MTMAYIIGRQSANLAQAVHARRTACCSPPAFPRRPASLVMGLYANYPTRWRRECSLNAYFTYSVCWECTSLWQTALGVVFFSGVLFIPADHQRVREQIVNGIPIA